MAQTIISIIDNKSSIDDVTFGRGVLIHSSMPDRSFFNIAHKTHSPFVTNIYERSFGSNITASSRYTLEVPRHGDLLGECFIKMTLPKMRIILDTVNNWGTGADADNTSSGKVRLRLAPWFMASVIEHYDIIIGGNQIDRVYGDWMAIYAEMRPETEKTALKRMMGHNIDDDDSSQIFGPKGITVKYDNSGSVTKGAIKNNDLETYTEYANTSVSTDVLGTIDPINLYMPLDLWFCKCPSLAIPLVSLIHSPIKISITTSSFDKWGSLEVELTSSKLGTPTQGPSNIGKIVYDGDNSNIQQLAAPAWGAAETTAYTQAPLSKFGNMQAALVANYYFLGSKEIEKLRSEPLEYNISTHQKLSDIHLGTNHGNIRLTASNMLRTLVFAVQSDQYKQTDSGTKAQYPTLQHTYNYIKNNTESYSKVQDMDAIRVQLLRNWRRFPFIKTATVQLNSQNLTEVETEDIYSKVMPYLHRKTNNPTGIYVYDYNIDPDSYDQPAGGFPANEVNLYLKFTACDLDSTISEFYVFKHWALSYNVLRIVDGIGALGFSV